MWLRAARRPNSRAQICLVFAGRIPLGTESVALEALLEVRAMLRAIAAVRDPLIVTNAREQARNEIAARRSNK